MADSDEEYERRKARDKFRRERNDYDRRDDRRRDPRDQWDHDRSSGRSRDVWATRSRERSGRDPYGRDYDSRRREREYSPPQRHVSPPHVKRMRRDWDDGGYPHYDMPYSGGGGRGGDGGGGGPMHRGGHHGGPNWGPGPDMPNMQHQDGGPFNNQPGQRVEVDYPTQPPILTFKQFLSQQDDSISDQDAIKKYNEYKLDFKKQQVNEFFLAHKEEEWFKFKYHPEDSGKRKEEINEALKKRCSVFMDLLHQSRIDSVLLDVDKDDEIVKVLDAAVIKMEGGTDFDLQILDEPEVEEGSRSRQNSESVQQDKSPLDQGKKRKREESTSGKSDKAPDQPLKINISGEQKELMKKAKEFSKQQQNVDEEATAEPQPMEEGVAERKEKEKPSSKKKNIRGKSSYNYESGSGSGSESGSDSESDSDSEPAPPGVENDIHPPGLDISGDSVPDTENLRSAETSTEPKEDKEEKHDEEKEVDTTEKEKEEEEGEEEEEEEEVKDEPKPQALHKTVSIFLRNLAPSITKQEVEAMCKKYSGFMRVALQDPQPERRFFRRGWVTFERNSNIKNICWDLNNIRLRDCELGATLNRELKLRVRPVNGLTSHKQVVRQDIQIAAKIIKNLDEKWKMWDDVEEEKRDTEKQPHYMLVSKNPVLKNITDYLVEEGSFEEEELLGQSAEEGERDSNPEFVVDRDDTILKVLDRMILYLRIVFSVDYYSANEYPNEDEMPHRCGIMHARGVVPSGKVTQNDVNEWMTNFENKTKHLVEMIDKLDEEEALKLGKKDPNTEVEKFVTANTQELAKDKWLCPLSGKKFKGPEFVRKHLFNKHSEKVDEVKTEVAFFNNYLLDPKRPALPEHPGNKQGGPVGPGPGPGPGPQGGFHGPMQQGMMGYNQPRPPMMYGGGPPSYNSPYNNRDNYRGDYYRRGNYSHRGFRRRPDPRGIIEYRDLDAPDDVDIF